MANELPKIDGYRLNRFVISARVRPGWMLYNTTTGGIVYIRGEKDLYESLNSLRELYFFIPIDFDEIKWVDDLRAKMNTKSCPENGVVNGFTVLTSTDCNARCFYCYEKIQHKLSMSDKVAYDVADFIIKKASGNPLSIRWFGGEPLVNIKAIDIISSSLINKGIRFKSSMISNGLLFTDSLILKARENWHLRRVQVTIDGTKDVYQKAKSYRNASGNEFEKVIDNVSKLIDAKIHVSIRLNQDLYNTSDLIDLVDFLSLRFRGNNFVSVYNNLLYDEEGRTDDKLNATKYKEFLRLQTKISESGLSICNPLKKKIRLTHCMADNDLSLIIMPDGSIGKCEHFTDSHLIGTIYDSKREFEEILRWKEIYEPTKRCIECPLYPQCVRIKMCPEEKESCSLIQCENKIELIKKSLIKLHETTL